MTVSLNGSRIELPPGSTLAEAVEQAGVGGGRRGVAVALDGEVVPRGDWGRTPLREGQRIEVVAAVQGG